MRVEFKGESGARQYEICFEALVLNASPVPTADWDTVVDLLRKLKAIGQPGQDHVGSVTLYQLRAGHTELDLEKAEMKMLLMLIDQSNWKIVALEAVIETRKMLRGVADG